MKNLPSRWWLTSLFAAVLLPAYSAPAPTFGVKPPLRAWIVPALSAQRILPHLPEPQIVITNTPGLDFLAARGEVEPASFVLRSPNGVEKLELIPSPLTGDGGETLPPIAVDLYAVGVWWQAGNAWFLPEREGGAQILVPELLLHDASLARPGAKTQENSVRKTGGGVADFGPDAPAFIAAADAPAFQPLPLEAKKLRQFYVLFHAPAQAKPGIYRGTVAVRADGADAGAIPVTARVLPFELPAPATRQDHGREFAYLLAAGDPLHGRLAAGQGRETIAAAVNAEYADIARHGVRHLLFDAAFGARTLRGLADKAARAGLSKEPLWISAGPASTLVDQAAPTSLPVPDLDALAAAAGAPSAHALLATRDAATLEGLVAKGHRPFLFANPDSIYSNLAPVLAGAVCDRLPYFHLVARWHAIDAQIFRTSPAPGVENPEHWRRQVGVVPFRGDADGVLIPGFYDTANPWAEGGRKGMRSPALVYPTENGLLSTLAWEGVREGIKDVRYLTYLLQLADKCAASPDMYLQTEARRAGVWIRDMRVGREDLDEIRLETIALILRMQQLLDAAK